MDILLENGRYQDAMKLFDYATNKFDFDVKYPVDSAVLYFAACYKLVSFFYSRENLLKFPIFFFNIF